LWPGQDAKLRYETVQRAVDSYLKEMEVPDFIIKKMFSVPSTQLAPLSRDEITMIDRRSLWPPYLEEMMLARCSSNTQCREQFGRNLYQERLSELEKMD
jgi:hypothetical protein